MPFTHKRLFVRLQRFSLAGIAAALAGLVALVVCVALGHQYNRELRHSTLEYGRGNAAMLARVLEDQMDRLFVVVDKNMRQADALLSPDISPAQVTERLRQLDYAQSLVRSISVIDAAGRVLASSNSDNIDVTLSGPLLQSLALSAPLRQITLNTVWAGHDLVDVRPLRDVTADGALAVEGRDASHTAIPVVLRSHIPGRYILAIFNPKYLVARHQQILGTLYDSTRIYSRDGRVLLQANLQNTELGTLQKQDPVFSRYLQERGIGDYLEVESGDPVAFRASEQYGGVIKVRMSAAHLLERVGTNGGRIEAASMFGGLLLFGMAVCVAFSLGVSKRTGLALQRSHARLATSEAELRRHRDDLTSLVAERTVHLERATAEALEANRAKSEFLANMSHELRTPMHAILSFSQFGLDRLAAGRTDKMERYFSNIHTSGRRLLELLNDLLDLSKLEAGRMEIRKSACSLQDIAADVVEEMRAMLTQARLECSVSASPAAQGLSVHADPARIRQVVHNLLGNALKFTPAGGSIAVEIDCGSARGLGNDDAHWDQVTLDDAGAERHVAILRVRDNGCGIPEGELDLIFDKFAQSSKTKTAAGGTGLGLAICREIMAAHEGSIRARNNRAGPGAVFELVLPLVLVPA